MEHIITVRPIVKFNELIVAMTDERLGLNGKLVRTVGTWLEAQKSLSIFRF
jgi:predicted protein tyrosine phosphatase